MAPRLGLVLTCFAVACALVKPAVVVDAAADSVTITVPTAVAFMVNNVSTSTIGSPAPSSLSFSNLQISGSNFIRISVKADSNFVPPGGAAIPASNVSWTTSGASNGTGSSGTLSTSIYNQVFQSANGKKSGSVGITWTLGAVGTGIRAGNHSLVVRWKLEAIN